MRKFFKNHCLFSALTGIIISVFLVALVAYAATTISTNISTGGTLTVSGAATTTKSHYIGGTASTTELFVQGATHLGGNVEFDGIVTSTAEYIYVQTVKFAPSATPTPAVAGKCFVDDTDNQLNCYDGSNWQQLW